MSLLAIFHRLSDKLLDAAMAAETKKAGLATDSVALPFGKMVYLRSIAAPKAGDEPIVMLHGAASDKSAWVRLAQQLDVAFPILIPDLPGHGDSDATGSMQLGIASQARYVSSFLNKLGIKRAHLIGNSMGGTIALHLAATEPALVATLILIDAAGAQAKPSWLRSRCAKGAPNPMIDVADVGAYREMIRIGMQSPPYIPGFLMASLARRFIARRAINARIARDIEADLDQTALLDKISAETLIIWGEQDRVLHVDDAELLRRAIRRSSKVLLPGIGHAPMVEAPKQVARLCKDFYASL
jgi:pimeloyl-ACP methyl ester carboxylesterase